MALKSKHSATDRNIAVDMKPPRVAIIAGDAEINRAMQRTNDGLGVALWLLPGVHGDDGPLEAVIAGSIIGEKQGEKQAEAAAVFEQTEHYRPTEPHWYLSLPRSSQTSHY